MINIKVYKNGYEIIGHAEERICHQVSLWHWISSNLILGTDDEAKEYTSARDNIENPSEGYSWVTYNSNKYNLAWIAEDFIVSAESWCRDNWENQVHIERIDNMLIKK